ncbi:MAG: ABC transporter permease [Chloroflexi bacterium]|nr:ABC transporter permease [Chloroflexota bacterium]
MNKTFLVMRHEFWRHITRRSFIFAILGMPTIILLVAGGVILFFTSKGKDPVGVVDLAKVTMEPSAYKAIEADTVPFTTFTDETAALDALNEKEIQAYAVIPANYLETGQATLYHNGDAFDEISGELADYLRASLLAESDPILQERFRDNNLNVAFISLSENGGGNPVAAIIMPFIIGFIFLISIFATSGFLIQAIVDEKENRTMEILITSLKPSQLMIGKIVGLVGLGFIQIAVWLGLAALGVAIAQARIPGFEPIAFSRSVILVAAGWFVPFYVLNAAIITAIGISITAVSEGQQIIGIVNILSVFPLYFTGLIVENPNSGLSVTLSMIPFSAPLTMLTRSQLTTVPPWQYAASWGILTGTAVFALYLVSRLLQFGLLRYGKKLTWREMAGALRTR